MNAVAKLGPVAVSVAAHDWGAYHAGIFDLPLTDVSNTDVNHLVVLEGYGTDQETGLDYWLVRNSWGPMWGEKGYIRLKRSNTDLEPNCGIDTRPKDGVACSKDEDGNDVVPPPALICGTCGILYDTAVPLGGYLV
jgi:cathepsin L